MTKLQLGRLAFRREDRWWNCYVANSDDMKDTILIGSILGRVIDENDDIKAQFITCMRNVFTYVVKESLGIDVDIEDAQPAPEKDRTKPS